MGLADEIREEAKLFTGGRRVSRVDALLTELPDEDREPVRELLADRGVSVGVISRVLRNNGYQIDPKTIRYWRDRVAS